MFTATQTAPEIAQPNGFIGQDRAEQRNNPHAYRYGYMPGVYHAQANPRTTGYNFFPQGQLIRFQTFTIGGEQNPQFEQDPKQHSLVREISAEMAAKNASIEYASFQGIDSGFVLLQMLDNRDDAAAYFEALHPAFSAVGHSCPSGLSVCPTCRIEWLESAAGKQYFHRQMPNADLDIALQIKQRLYESCTNFRQFCTEQWRECVDLYERSRTGGASFIMRDEHHHIRKCLHELTLEQREEKRLQQMTDANAKALGSVIGSVGGTGTGIQLSDAELAEIYAKRAKSAKVEIVTEVGGEPVAITSDGTGQDVMFAVNDIVLCEGEKGTITELKPGGWYAVTLESGEIKTVRKDKLQKEQINEQI